MYYEPSISWIIVYVLLQDESANLSFKWYFPSLFSWSVSAQYICLLENESPSCCLPFLNCFSNDHAHTNRQTNTFYPFLFHFSTWASLINRPRVCCPEHSFPQNYLLAFCPWNPLHRLCFKPCQQAYCFHQVCVKNVQKNGMIFKNLFHIT